MDRELEEGVALEAEELKMHFGGVKAVDGRFQGARGRDIRPYRPERRGRNTVFNCITQFY
ncbi:MAG: hypothetical protein ACLUFK_12130 [Oscillospiraceae bacterium]